MAQISVEHNAGGISGLHIITPKVHGDERGYFIETYHEAELKEAGIDTRFVQDNQSMSVRGVLRGMHYQKNYPQAKLIRVISGSVFDAVIDLRKDSDTFGRWHGIVLSAENHRQIFVPEGFAHGFLVLSDRAEVFYKCNDFYHPDDEGGIAWNDPEIGIEWPGIENGEGLIISEKDQKWKSLKETIGLPGQAECETK